MGCDIHLYVEVKKKGEWIPSIAEFKDDYREGVVSTQQQNPYPEYDDGNFRIYDAASPGRNYSLFAVLADVRNGYGFAGIDTGDGYRPIDMPRGLPSDVSKIINEESESWGRDGHSHSWFTLAELQEYDWETPTVVRRGVVEPSEYIEFKENGKPNSWAGAVSGGSVINLTNEQMDKLLDEIPGYKNIFIEGMLFPHYYTQVQWKESYGNAVGQFWHVRLKEFAKLGKPDKVRIVFWFDN